MNHLCKIKGFTFAFPPRFSGLGRSKRFQAYRIVFSFFFQYSTSKVKLSHEAARTNLKESRGAD